MSFWWWRYEKVELVSPYSPDACLERLRASSGSEMAIFEKASVIAYIRKAKFRLRKTQSLLFPNHFQTFVYGLVSRERGATRIDCRIGVDHAAFSLCVLWIFFAWVGYFYFVVVNGRMDFSGKLLASLAPLFATAMMSVFAGFGRLRARNERQSLLDFLHETIDAREKQRSQPSAVERAR